MIFVYMEREVLISFYILEDFAVLLKHFYVRKTSNLPLLLVIFEIFCAKHSGCCNIVSFFISMIITNVIIRGLSSVLPVHIYETFNAYRL